MYSTLILMLIHLVIEYKLFIDWILLKYPCFTIYHFLYLLYIYDKLSHLIYNDSTLIFD